LGGEFHSSTICERFNPFVAHAAPPKRFYRDDTPRDVPQKNLYLAQNICMGKSGEVPEERVLDDQEVLN
jgi:hypothetical protein